MWRALEADVTGARSYIIANADTVMTTPSAELMAQVWPEVKLTREVGEFETLMSIDRARRELGYEPRHSWRDHVQPPA
jgi:nucleoside-diphosphate-sugar epimerase